LKGLYTDVKKLVNKKMLRAREDELPHSWGKPAKRV